MLQSSSLEGIFSNLRDLYQYLFSGVIGRDLLWVTNEETSYQL